MASAIALASLCRHSLVFTSVSLSQVLALPYAVANTGWIGFVLLGVFATLSCATGALLGRCWSVAQAHYADCAPGVLVREPYPTLGYKCFGQWARVTIALCIDLTYVYADACNSNSNSNLTEHMDNMPMFACRLFGAAIVFLVLSSTLLHTALERLLPASLAPPSFCLLMPVVAALLVPLAWLGTPKDFWPLALGAGGATALAIVLLFAQTLRAVPHVEASERGLVRAPDVHRFLLAIGTLMFAFSGHPAFPTYAPDTVTTHSRTTRFEQSAPELSLDLHLHTLPDETFTPVSSPLSPLLSSPHAGSKRTWQSLISSRSPRCTPTQVRYPLLGRRGRLSLLDASSVRRAIMSKL